MSQHYITSIPDLHLHSTHKSINSSNLFSSTPHSIESTDSSKQRPLLTINRQIKKNATANAETKLEQKENIDKVKKSIESTLQRAKQKQIEYESLYLLNNTYKENTGKARIPTKSLIGDKDKKIDKQLDSSISSTTNKHMIHYTSSCSYQIASAYNQIISSINPNNTKTTLQTILPQKTQQNTQYKLTLPPHPTLKHDITTKIPAAEQLTLRMAKRRCSKLLDALYNQLQIDRQYRYRRCAIPNQFWPNLKHTLQNQPFSYKDIQLLQGQYDPSIPKFQTTEECLLNQLQELFKKSNQHFKLYLQHKFEKEEVIWMFDRLDRFHKGTAGVVELVREINFEKNIEMSVGDARRIMLQIGEDQSLAGWLACLAKT